METKILNNVLVTLSFFFGTWAGVVALRRKIAYWPAFFYWSWMCGRELIEVNADKCPSPTYLPISAIAIFVIFLYRRHKEKPLHL